MGWSFENDLVYNWVHFENFLSKKECDDIIEHGKNLNLKDALINHDKELGVLDTTIRESKIAWITPNPDTEFLYRRLIDVIQDGNSQYFNFDIHALDETIQFTEYNAPSGKYDMHIDKHFLGKVRKLSVIIQLTDPSEYEGGDVEIIYKKDPDIMPKSRGGMILFPSYMVHRVSPVTSGTRHSLVCWVSGKPFK